jgi:hypothetical protein
MGFVDELEDVVVEHAIPLPCLKEKYLNFLLSKILICQISQKKLGLFSACWELTYLSTCAKSFNQKLSN